MLCCLFCRRNRPMGRCFFSTRIILRVLQVMFFWSIPNKKPSSRFWKNNSLKHLKHKNSQEACNNSSLEAFSSYAATVEEVMDLFFTSSPCICVLFRNAGINGQHRSTFVNSLRNSFFAEKNLSEGILRKFLIWYILILYKYVYIMYIYIYLGICIWMYAYM